MRFGLGLLLVICVLASRVHAAEPVAWYRDLSRKIDDQIEHKLKAKNLTPAKRAEESALLRRIYLDVVGRIPTGEETAAFLADKSPDKHHQLIDTLLAHEEMPVYWRRVINGWLNSSLSEPPFGQEKFLAYLQESLAADKPWDELARELLEPKLADEKGRWASWFLTSRLKGERSQQLDDMTTAVASSLFGVQLQCAKCHDHPFVDEWKQDHYYGLTAFLGRTEGAKFKDIQVLKERADGQVTFTTTKREEKTAKLMFLDGHIVEEPPLPTDKSQWYEKAGEGEPDRPKFSRRRALAEYAISERSPFFKRSLVNRVWKQLLGRGLVEPVDQMHEANPASHPELLALLADDFAASGFRLRRLLAAILHSETYLRDSRWDSSSRPPDDLYAAARLKPLSPDQLAISLSVATGHFDAVLAKAEREKANRKLDRVTLGTVRPIFEGEQGYPMFAKRMRNDGELFEANTSQALFLTYNPLLRGYLKASPTSLLSRLVKLTGDEQIAREAYLRILSREPTADETAEAVAFLAADKSDKMARERNCQDLMWALLASAEFRFNH